jgi:DNA topoisomerase-1
MPKGRVYRTKSKGAQEAHESIRPTSFHREPDALAGTLSSEELRLYRLIWQRAIASQMAAKEMETTSVDLAAGPYELRGSATRTLFDGFSRVYTEGRDDGASDEEEERRLPPLAEGDVAEVREVTPTQHFTEPPPRYTEATLIKALEEHGIGRPSTYAATISTIVDRGYVRVEDRRLRPEIVAGIVTDLLVEHFGDYVDLAFTARMEEELDEVARGERAWVPLLRAFYGPLRDRVDEKRKELRRADFTTEATDEVCSLGHPMVIRLGRNGRFLACSLFPEHKESRPLPGDEVAPQAGEGEVCPQCGEGTLVGKTGRFGPFVGCSRYPDCNYIRKEGPPPPEPLPFEVVCPKNRDGRLVARRARRTGNVFYGCSNYPTCDYTTNFEPVGAVHDADEGPVARKGDSGICLICGADVPLADGNDVVGARLEGGPPNPEALARPARGGRRGGGGGRGGGGSGRSTSSDRTNGARPAARRARRTESAPDA